MNQKLGFITPTYNRPEMLERLYRSLLAGDDSVDWCHYVIDDGSKADYSEVVLRCSALGPHFVFERIDNSGPLVARNRAMDLALQDRCTHLCFIDDDNELLANSRSHIVQRIREFPHIDWFVFRCVREGVIDNVWPLNVTTMSWFDDIVRKKVLGSDNPVVVSSRLVGTTRFSRRGRNQREWTFFLELSRKNDHVLVCPDSIMIESYQAGGLSDIARNNKSSLAQVSNSVERAVRYWLRRPLSFQLFGNVLWQIASAPPKVIFGLRRREMI